MAFVPWSYHPSDRHGHLAKGLDPTKEMVKNQTWGYVPRQFPTSRALKIK